MAQADGGRDAEGEGDTGDEAEGMGDAVEEREGVEEGESSSEGGEAPKAAGEAVPSCYNKDSKLTVEVTSSTTTFDFDLKSDCSTTGSK